ncbi:MAG: YeeE/YedE thiosulfate transporter family protein, partial [Arenicellales bacterium]|nr:YeeE/YedE thiosulfate transporter family protein [Arenicellales bacterium]
GQRTLVRVGGGNLKSLLVLIVMAITAYATLRGLLAIIRIEVFDALAIDLAARDIADQGIGTLLAHFTDTSAVTVSRIVA